MEKSNHDHSKKPAFSEEYTVNASQEISFKDVIFGKLSSQT